jgi:DNA-directed RNA polymerase subunit H (RpoH/RPB5)
MSVISNNRILKIHNSRKNLLEILEIELSYNVNDYSNFSINEIDAMYSNSQLDMLLQHTSDDKKIYVKYYLSARQIRPANVDEIVEDLFTEDNILTQKDTLVIIVDDEPNDTILAKIKYLYDHDGIFIVLHNINRLQFNILKHKLVPDAYILNDEDIQKLQTEYHLKSLSQLPEISRFDPQAMALCMRPGQVVKFIRNSATALDCIYYRICI